MGGPVILYDYFIRGGKCYLNTHTQKRTEAQRGMMQLKAKDHQGLMATTES